MEWYYVVVIFLSVILAVIVIGSMMFSSSGGRTAYQHAHLVGTYATVDAMTDERVDLSAIPPTVDGVMTTEGTRVLFAGQDDKCENGIYVVDNHGSLVRTPDLCQPKQCISGNSVYVSGGGVKNGARSFTIWIMDDRPPNREGFPPSRWAPMASDVLPDYPGEDGCRVVASDTNTVDGAEWDCDTVKRTNWSMWRDEDNGDVLLRAPAGKTVEMARVTGWDMFSPGKTRTMWFLYDQGKLIPSERCDEGRGRDYWMKIVPDKPGTIRLTPRTPESFVAKLSTRCYQK